VAPMGVCLVPDTSDECTIEPGRTLGERIFSVPPVLLFAVGALIGVFGRPLWGLFVAAYHAYEAAAIARPLITKSATSGVAYLVGDIIAQVAVPRTNAEAGSRALNRGRVVRSTAAGLVSHGPQLHVWTVLLERYVNFGGVVWSLPLKIFLDQTFFASYLNAAYCFFIEAMQRRPLREIGRREALPTRMLAPSRPLHARRNTGPSPTGAQLMVAEPQGILAVLADRARIYLLCSPSAPPRAVGRRPRDRLGCHPLILRREM